MNQKFCAATLRFRVRWSPVAMWRPINRLTFLDQHALFRNPLTLGEKSWFPLSEQWARERERGGTQSTRGSDGAAPFAGKRQNGVRRFTTCSSRTQRHKKEKLGQLVQLAGRQRARRIMLCRRMTDYTGTKVAGVQPQYRNSAPTVGVLFIYLSRHREKNTIIKCMRRVIYHARR